MVETNYTIENIYQGGHSSLNPSYGDVFTGYRVSAGQLGAPTKPDTANQIQHLNLLLNQGMIPIEVGALDPRVFDQIPKQHFKEMRQAAQLAGGKISLHAPLIEVSGMGEQGWTETSRELAERQLMDVIDKASELDQKEKVPVTIHSSGLPGTEWEMTPDGKKIQKLVLVDQTTGKAATAMEEEEKYYLQYGDKPETLSPERRMEIANSSNWDNEITQLIFNKERADELLNKSLPVIEPVLARLSQEKPEKRRKIMEELSKNNPDLQNYFSTFENAKLYIQDLQMHADSLYDKAMRLGDDTTKKAASELAKDFHKEMDKSNGTIKDYSKALNNFLYGLKGDDIKPRQYVPVEEFALEKSAKTLSNVAIEAYKKYKDKAPILSIENMYPGMAFSSAEEMDKLIGETKNKFIEKAKKEGISESVAKKQANKMIGMTLDVGHLNVAKKNKFKDKDLRKEVEQIAKHVTHVHLTDNFGYGDSHLPPGMGNVPFKEIMEELEKQGKGGKEIRKIVEAGGWVQHFGTSPLPHSLEGMGSPIYAEGPGPYWNQAVGLQQGYFTGMGNMLPQVNYETFGAGFSQLPSELGGSRMGAQGSRMSGRGME